MKKYELKPEFKNVILTIPNYKLGNGTITIDTKNITDYEPEILIDLGFHIFNITEVDDSKKYTNEKNERKSKRSQE